MHRPHIYVNIGDTLLLAPIATSNNRTICSRELAYEIRAQQCTDSSQPPQYKKYLIKDSINTKEMQTWEITLPLQLETQTGKTLQHNISAIVLDIKNEHLILGGDVVFTPPFLAMAKNNFIFESEDKINIIYL